MPIEAPQALHKAVQTFSSFQIEGEKRDPSKLSLFTPRFRSGPLYTTIPYHTSKPLLICGGIK